MNHIKPTDMKSSDAVISSYECNFSIYIEEPEKFSALTGFVKITFITARITASLDCPLIIIITLNNNGEPLQKSLIFLFSLVNYYYLVFRDVFTVSPFVVYCLLFLFLNFSPW